MKKPGLPESIDIDDVVDRLLKLEPEENHSERWLNDHYPELMPELKKQLDLARKIRAAAEQAKQSPSSKAETTPLEEEIDFLNTEIDGYDIIEPLGQGGQAAVFKAIQRSTKRTVAIKVILQGPLASPHHQRRFLKEIQLISRVQHPNIVSIFESGVVKGQYWYAMEYIDGMSLDEYAVLRHPISEIVGLFETIVRAFGAAHQHGIIHRDVKPGNIVVDGDGVPHIVDFGLAKDMRLSSTEKPLSMDGQVLGTVPYLSPEQVREGDRGATVKSDVYSLGVVLYQLLTGVYPYPMSDSFDTNRQSILHLDPVHPRKARLANPNFAWLPPGVISDDLAQIILKALQKDEERRYQTAFALADDLSRYLKGEAVEAKADDAYYVFKKTLRRYKMQVTVVSAFFVLLLGSLAGVIYLWQGQKEISHKAQLGLDAGSYVKHGSVLRDEGRKSQAIAMYKMALEISQLTGVRDPIVLKNRFDACYLLARLYYSDGHFEDADFLSRIASELAEEMHRQQPDDGEWHKRLALSYALRAHGAYKAERWHDVIVWSEKATPIIKDFLSREPHNLSMKLYLANTCRRQGRCHLVRNEYSAALAQLLNSYRLATELYEAEPEAAEYTLNLVRSERDFTRYHLKQENLFDSLMSVLSFMKASERIRQLGQAEDIDGLKAEYEILRNDMSAYPFYIVKQLKQNIIDLYEGSGGGSSSVSVGKSSPSSSGLGSPSLIK
ncbi:MAG: serine/threonine protein kinase [Phycisphaerales bacterium]|nr:serine/threonine protein kinase [Phycisphaerales bacterium]